MKLISLNTWGASRGQLLFDFIKEQAQNTDIFCLQEVFSAPPEAPATTSGARMRLFEELQEILPEFYGLFCPNSSGFDFKGAVNFPVKHGLAVFIKKNITILSNQVVSFGPGGGDPAEGETKAQSFILSVGGKDFSVINYHGPARPGDKTDTPQRLANSQNLKAVWDGLPPGAKILCGDFNLMPETESVKILEGCGKNLIKEFKIANTRNEVSWKIYNNRQFFADYVFVSPEVKVRSFKVPYNEISDHLPMILEFETYE